MLTILKTCGEALTVLPAPEADCWINLVQPTMDEAASVSRDCGVPLSFLTDPLDADETPRVDVDDPHMLIVIRTPRFDSSFQVQHTTSPLGVILSPDRVITVSTQKESVLEPFASGKARNFSTLRRTRFILHVFRMTSLLYLSHLKEINKKTTNLEAQVRKSLRNEALIGLLDLEKGLVYFTTALRSNDLVMERVQKTQLLKMSPEDQELLEDVIIDNRQAIQMADIYSNILSGMMDAFASVISNNLSTVIKFLTSVTIILMLPTLVASFYGMNVKLPFQSSPSAFLITMLASLIPSAIAVVIFVRKRWF